MKKLLCFVIPLMGSVAAKTQTTVFRFGVIEKIKSEALNEERTLNIYLPQGYHPDSSTKYPVIYLLDGSAHEDYPHMAGLAQFMNMYGLLPPSIVVGIANVNRYRDFTSPTQVAEEKKKIPNAGGSQKFMDFVEKELQPFINKNYRTNGTNTIVGQSLGGLMVAQFLFERPALFDQYIAVSPSLWWNKFALLDQAGQWLDNKKQAGKKVYIGVGDEPADMIEGSWRLQEALEKYCGNSCSVFREILPKENHATILHRSAYQAFEWLYPVKK